MNNRHKRDDVHKEIVEALRRVGISVHDISQLKGGAGDIIVGRGGVTFLFEIKTPGSEVLTADEKKFIGKWNGQWAIITSAHEAMVIMGGIKSEDYPKTRTCYNYRPGSLCVYGWRTACDSCPNNGTRQKLPTKK